MAAIRRFEDIRAWQKARQLVNRVYALTNTGAFAKDFGLRDQIRRAAGSIMHNIAEGFDSGSDAEFRRFLNYSVRSATETQSQLYTALDQSYIGAAEFEELYLLAGKTKGDIRKFIDYLNGANAIAEEVSSYSTELTPDSGLRTLDNES